MVLAAVDRITHETAASTAASIHMHFEGSVVETPLGSFTGVDDVDGIAVVAPEQGVVEWFPHPEQDLGALRALADDVADRGWRICLIVPASAMGEAHTRLRGAALTLQPWWPDGDLVRFGGPEVP